MKNYIITIKTRGDEKYDTITMAKVLSNVVAFCADLYSIDYHGIEHGIFMYYEEDEEMYYIKVIINNFDCNIYDLKETAEDLVNNFSRYGTFNDISSEIKELSEPTEIPENYIEHYYVNSYHDFY